MESFVVNLLDYTNRKKFAYGALDLYYVYTFMWGTM